MASLILNIALFVAAAAVVLLLARLVIGPTIADRGVALDTMTIVVISLIVFIANVTGRAIYLDVAIVYALISFLSIVALARYIEGGL